jgi:hypothetical protein
MIKSEPRDLPESFFNTRALRKSFVGFDPFVKAVELPMVNLRILSFLDGMNDDNI